MNKIMYCDFNPDFIQGYNEDTFLPTLLILLVITFISGVRTSVRVKTDHPGFITKKSSSPCICFWLSSSWILERLQVRHLL